MRAVVVKLTPELSEEREFKRKVSLDTPSPLTQQEMFRVSRIPESQFKYEKTPFNAYPSRIQNPGCFTIGDKVDEAWPTLGIASCEDHDTHTTRVNRTQSMVRTIFKALLFAVAGTTLDILRPRRNMKLLYRVRGNLNHGNNHSEDLPWRRVSQPLPTGTPQAGGSGTAI